MPSSAMHSNKESACASCIDSRTFVVTVGQIKTKCKYHPHEAMRYDQASCTPQGMCGELMYTAYSAALSLLYGGKPRKSWLRQRGLCEVSVSCPVNDGITLLLLKKEVLPAPVRMLKELAEEAAKVFWRPVDAPFRNVAMQVSSPVAGCPKVYHRGQKFEFNTHGSNELCPAGFTAIYPYLRYLEQKSNGGNKTMRIHCPDHAGVLYDVSAGQDSDAKLDFLTLCDRGTEKQPALKVGDKALAAILPEDFCLLAFNSVFAYLRTLASGGWFNWVDHGGKVIVHCPCPQGVTFTIGPVGNGEQYIMVEVAEGGECPRQYRKGRAFLFSLDTAMLAPMIMLHQALPHLVESFAHGGKP